MPRFITLYIIQKHAIQNFFSSGSLRSTKCSSHVRRCAVFRIKKWLLTQELRQPAGVGEQHGLVKTMLTKMKKTEKNITWAICHATGRLLINVPRAQGYVTGRDCLILLVDCSAGMFQSSGEEETAFELSVRVRLDQLGGAWPYMQDVPRRMVPERVNLWSRDR